MKQPKKEKFDTDQKSQQQKDNKKKKQSTQPSAQPGGLTKEDLPDATNESTGQVGSGLRQDSN